MRPGVRGDATELLTEAVVERREICESGSCRVPLNHIAGRIERVVVGGRDGGNPPLSQTARPVPKEVRRDAGTFHLISERVVVVNVVEAHRSNLLPRPPAVRVY